jgi:hypothetical protein
MYFVVSECAAPTSAPVHQTFPPFPTPDPDVPREVTPNATPAPTPNPTPGPTRNPTPAPTPNPTPAPIPNPTPGPTPAPGSDEECPLVTWDFSDLTAGTYIHDEMWDKWGIKVTAIKSGAQGYTPINGSHQSVGGGAMVFDSSRPVGSSLYGCASGDGDPDLGSPNSLCPNSGPGIGEGGAEYRNGVLNPFRNCDSLGNILIIQESDKSCPDDTGSGGWLQLDFRDPSFVEASSLLDVDEGSTPDIDITLGDGSLIEMHDTPGTGENGLLFQPIQLDQVKQIKIHYYGSGSINALTYRLCPPGANVYSESPPTPSPVSASGASGPLNVDFEDGTLGPFTSSGSGNNGWTVSDAADCVGTYGAKTIGTTTNDVHMSMTVPDGVNKVSYKYSVPCGVFETTDSLHVYVDDTRVREYEATDDIRDNGRFCEDDSFAVSPGETLRFTAKTSATNEYFEIDEIFFSYVVIFENGLGPFVTSGSGSNGWTAPSTGNSCFGSSDVAKTTGQTSNDVHMSMGVPAGFDRMSYKYYIPSGVFDENDSLHVFVGGSRQREYEADSNIRSNGITCAEDTVSVSPGDEVKFTVKTSHVSEYMEIGDVEFWKA